MIGGSTKNFFHNDSFGFKAIRNGKALIRHFTLENNSFENNSIHAFRHLFSTTNKHSPFLFEKMLMKVLFIFLEKILNIYLFINMLSTLGQSDLDYSFLLISLEVLSEIIICIFILNAIVTK